MLDLSPKLMDRVISKKGKEIPLVRKNGDAERIVQAKLDVKAKYFLDGRSLDIKTLWKDFVKPSGDPLECVLYLWHGP